MTKNELLKKLVIAIDGPSGSGKTTTARLVANTLGLLHIDTGAMYRAITLKALKENKDLSDGEAMGNLAASSRIEFGDEQADGRRVILDGTDVTLEVRSPEVTNNVSLASSHLEVRRVMAKLQRRIAEGGGVVLEGRDIGSVILPSAHVKIFLLASIDVRAERRYLELKSRGLDVELEKIKEEIKERDHLDSTREISPLRMPVGAETVDTSGLTIEEQVKKVVDCVYTVLDRLQKASDAGSEPNALKIHAYFRAGQFLIRNFCRVFFGLRIFRTDKTVYNENYIYACNHLSYADPPLVGSTLPRELYFMAKKELFRFRPFAWLITKYHAIPIKRSSFDREAMEKALEVLKHNGSMLIFPEGTRMKGDVLGKPKSGIGFLAVNSGVPVVPVYVQGSNRLLRALFRMRPLRIAIGSPIRFTSRDTSRFKNSESYRAYSEMVMEAITALKDTYQK